MVELDHALRPKYFVEDNLSSKGSSLKMALPSIRGLYSYMNSLTGKTWAKTPLKNVRTNEERETSESKGLTEELDGKQTSQKSPSL